MASSEKPLAGKRVLVTRTPEQSGPLVELLREQGADVLVIPAIRIELIHPSPALDHCLRRLSDYQWLILTSANGVAALAERMNALGILPEAFAHAHCVAVGAATADAMRQLGLRVDLVPDEYVADSLVEAVKDQVAGQHVLLIRGTLARDVIPPALIKAGATVDTADAYHTVIPADSVAKVRSAFLSTTPPDIVTFTSSSTVNNFIRLVNAAGLSERPEKLRAASIGPVTSSTLREHGWEPWVEAHEHTVPGLVRAMCKASAGIAIPVASALRIRPRGLTVALAVAGTLLVGAIVLRLIGYMRF